MHFVARAERVTLGARVLGSVGVLLSLVLLVHFLRWTGVSVVFQFSCRSRGRVGGQRCTSTCFLVAAFFFSGTLESGKGNQGQSWPERSRLVFCVRRERNCMERERERASSGDCHSRGEQQERRVEERERHLNERTQGNQAEEGRERRKRRVNN